ncbi:MAG: type II toxin-antitoxin system ParD family antitoxin [Pirellulales bacterium]|nr:type II toxin-antitoxin system ParD family antitoxin [Pirellulales bacterium]
MALQIPTELQAFVNRELRTGRYSSELELVSEALRMLERERQEALAGVLEGMADVEAGRMVPLHEVFDEIRRVLPPEQPT